MRFAKLSILLLFFGVTASVSADIVYDNLDVPMSGGRSAGHNNYRPANMIAQPFFLCDNNTVASATLAMYRIGAPDGTVHVDVFDDSSTGTPGASLGRLGSIDAMEIDLFAKTPGQSADFADYTFDSPVTGLTPNEQYFLVYSQEGGDNWVHHHITEKSVGVGWSGTDRSRGSNGAGSPFLIDPPNVPDWLVLHADSNLGIIEGPPIPVWLHARIEATSMTAALMAGDADQDLDFDQMDLVQVQVASKYLTGEPATWGEGDWNGAPGGTSGNPPAGDGLFDQFDIIAAQQANVYLQGPYSAIKPGGAKADAQTSLVYDAGTGELAVDVPSGQELTSINVTSAAGKFVGAKPVVLDGAFDNFAADNVFKATFGGSFGAISFGNVLPPGIAEAVLADDLSTVGSLAGGGDLGEVDLVYIPEPTAAVLILCAVLGLALRWRRR